MKLRCVGKEKTEMSLKSNCRVIREKSAFDLSVIGVYEYRPRFSELSFDLAFILSFSFMIIIKYIMKEMGER